MITFFLNNKTRSLDVEINTEQNIEYSEKTLAQCSMQVISHLLESKTNQKNAR